MKNHRITDRRRRSPRSRGSPPLIQRDLLEETKPIQERIVTPHIHLEEDVCEWIDGEPVRVIPPLPLPSKSKCGLCGNIFEDGKAYYMVCNRARCPIFPRGRLYL